MTMKRLLMVALFSAVTTAWAADDAKPFVANWALTIPGGGAGWLGVEETNGALKASILWGGGSVLPVTTVKVEGDTLVVTRVTQIRKGGQVVGRETETIKAKLEGDKMNLTTEKDRGDGNVFGKASFTGKRIPPLPPAPDLSKVKFGEPTKLFNGQDLTGWKLFGGRDNGWKAENGLLINDAKQEPAPAPRKSFGNLRTDREFEDFNLTLETRVAKGGNSGIYLRGIYEVQVADSYGARTDSHNMGGLYSRITPTENASKPAGEWQTFDITLVDRHVTVILNGKKVIDNKPLLGCTGGAMWSDQFRPGPLYLQGDHTGIEYRNIVLRPVVK
jgi:hypothetical protein